MILKHYHQIFTKTKKKKKKKVTFAVSDRCDVIKKTEDVGQVNRFFASQIIEAS